MHNDDRPEPADRPRPLSVPATLRTAGRLWQPASGLVVPTLRLTHSIVDRPDEPTAPFTRRSLTLADPKQLEWSRRRTLQLTVAAVLQARAEHLQRSKLDYFGGPLKLGGLALADGPRHLGQEGQAFEYAIAEAVNARRWVLRRPGEAPDGDHVRRTQPLNRAVTDVVREALNLLRVPPGRVQLIVAGLEKTRPGSLDGLLTMIAAGATLRDGRPGRPPNALGQLMSLADTNWQTMLEMERAHDARHSPGSARTVINQLGRADAFLTIGNHSVVAASMKVNRRDIPADGWYRVPLWFTTGPVPDAYSLKGATVPTVVVELPRIVLRFEHGGALSVVDAVLNAVQRGTPDPLWNGTDSSTHQLCAQLYSKADWQLSDVVDWLRLPPPAPTREVIPYILPTLITRRGYIITVDDPLTQDGWAQSADRGEIITSEHGHRAYWDLATRSRQERAARRLLEQRENGLDRETAARLERLPTRPVPRPPSPGTATPG